MSGNVAADVDALWEEVKSEDSGVATNPHGTFHFCTGRVLANRLGYDNSLIGSLPGIAVEWSCGQSVLAATARNR